jgi:hypothetical protein
MRWRWSAQRHPRVDRADPRSGLVAPAMPSDDAALERSGRPRRLLGAAVAALGVLFAAALPGLFDHGLPHRPARAEAAAPMAAVSSAPSLYFHGSGGEFLDFAPAGQRRP